MHMYTMFILIECITFLTILHNFLVKIVMLYIMKSLASSPGDSHVLNVARFYMGVAWGRGYEQS